MIERSWRTIERSLKELCDLMAADGYELQLAPVGDALTVNVEAGPGACKECLVPSDIFAGLVRQYLVDGLGPEAEQLPIKVNYPSVEH